ncbi:MAG: hypothetical protein H6636_14690 [Anaerolineales bacterium]|nr:hypothetical protein [Anaerolineales bacterium]
MDSIHQALRAWRQVDGKPESLLTSLLLVRHQQQSLDPTAQRLATNQILLEGLEALAEKDALGAQILRSRFLNGEAILKVAYQLNLSEYQVNRIQHKALENLADLLQTREQAYQQAVALELAKNLPPPSYTTLFGLENLQAKILDVLQRPTAPWLLALTGLGGLGKTALAHTLAQKVIPTYHFEHLLWVRIPGMLEGSAPPEQTFEALMGQIAAQLFPTQDPELRQKSQIRQTLKAAPHLVVIDNLETDAEALYLFEHLQDLGGPSKFLITSRTCPPVQANLLTIPLEELTQPEALALLRHQAHLTGQEVLVEAPVETLLPIYEATGGNPLALKLIVGLANLLPLPYILQDLPKAQIGQVEKLYTQIYLKTWQTLSPSARTLLQFMPLVAESGGTVAHLQALSALSERELSAALAELVTRSLLEMRGHALERRYGIHRLTETFLRTEIIHWE